LLVPKGTVVGISKGRIPLKMSINEMDINEYKRSVELSIEYFRGNIDFDKI